MKTVACLILLAAGNVLAGSDNARWVDPFIGTLANGHTTPAACRPFGLVQAGPDTGTGNWDHCSGYKDWDRAICGFSQTHLSGTGCSDLGDIRLLPFSSETPPAKCPFRKETESASPGAYAVTLHDEGVRVEATATEHVGVYRFSYGGRRARVLVDPQWGILSSPHCLTTHIHRASVAAPRSDCVEGWIEARHWAGRHVAFTVRFGRPATKVERLPLAPGEKAPKFVLDFDLGKDEPLVVKVALSARDVAHAGRNLEAEMPGWDFDSCRAEARAAWDAILSRMDVEGTDEQKKTAYTAFYHLCMQPNNLADAGEGVGYTTFSFWDTFRAANPLYTILVPEKVPQFVSSLVARAERAGFLPRWELWGHDNGCMIGAHAVPFLADAYLKGFPGDWEKAYAVARKTLTTVVGWKRDKEDWPVLDRYGYYPFDLKKRESASSTMEAAYDDWCMARFAEAMGKKEDAAYFAKRAQGWTNLFDAVTGFVRGRDSKGAWRTPFDPLSAGHGKAKFRDFTEGNAYQYTFHAMQEPERLIELCGGREKFVEKLDGIFSADARVVDAPPDMTGMVGQYSQGNEPSHHIAYFYALAGRPDRTAEIVRTIVDRFYTPRRDGLCGNEDCGQMSAWYLFSAMGFYPFSPCGGEYVLGAPQVPKVTLRISNRTIGRSGQSNTFTVIARGLSKENKYVRRVTLNGRPVIDGKIRHADIMKGGELVFEMAKAWTARESASAPASVGAPVEVKVDFSQTTGPVKPVNGVGQPPILGWDDFHLFHYLKEAGIPYSRLHDVGGPFGKGVFVDIPNLFRDFDADETNPENYDFAFTDPLLKALVENGVEPYFRLGITIENRVWRRPYRVFPPKDYAKWARICEHVIRHYTEGWAKGFTYRISHWEIWNEPENNPRIDDNPMWRGPFDSYVDLYLVAARHLKERFPHLMIGGYGSSGLYSHAGMDAPDGANVNKRTWHFITCFTNFLTRAEQAKAPFDFFSWHTYGHPDATRKMAEFARRELDRHGFAKTQISVNEWLPEPTAPKGTPGYPKLGTAHQAALVAAQLIAFHDAPVDDAEIYDARCGASSYSPLFNALTHCPYKAYKVFLAFNELRKLGTAVRVTAPQKGVWALAAAKDGNGAVLVVNISEKDCALSLKGEGWNVVGCRVIGEKHDYESVDFRGILAKDDVLLITMRREF